MSVNYGTTFSTDRDNLLMVLSDLYWHPHHELAHFGGNRFGARLLELKRSGYEIEDRPYRGSVVGKEYRLVSLTPKTPQQKRVKILLEEADVVQLLSGTVTPSAQAALQNALGSFRNNKHKL